MDYHLTHPRARMDYLVQRARARPFIFVLVIVLALIQVSFSNTRIVPGRGSNPRLKPINIVMLSPFDTRFIFSYYRIYPAMVIALEKVKAMHLLHGYEPIVRYHDTKCQDQVSSSFQF